MKVINFLYVVMFIMLALAILNYIFFLLGIDIKKDVVNMMTSVLQGG